MAEQPAAGPQPGDENQEHFGQPIVLPIRATIPLRLQQIQKEFFVMRRFLMMIIQMLLGSGHERWGHDTDSREGRLFLYYPRTPRKPNGRHAKFNIQKYENMTREEWIRFVNEFYMTAIMLRQGYESLRSLSPWKYRWLRKWIHGLMNICRTHINPQIMQVQHDILQYRNESLERKANSQNVMDLTHRLNHMRAVWQPINTYVNDLYQMVENHQQRLDPTSWSTAWTEGDAQHQALLNNRMPPPERELFVLFIYQRLSRLYYWMRPLEWLVPLEEFYDIESEVWKDVPV